MKIKAPNKTAIYMVLALAAWGMFNVLKTNQRKAMEKNQDQFCENILKNGKHSEALSWFKSGPQGEQRTVGELDNKQTLAIIEELYALGAREVIAAKIDSVPKVGETTNIFIVVLPADDDARHKLFLREAKHAKSMGFDPDRDHGQKYLFFYWS